MQTSPHIQQQIIKQNLIHANDKIIIGVSGGADSIALLCFLNTLKTKIGFQIHVAHINHHLRKSSNIDAHFVKKFAASLNLPYTCIDLDLKKEIKQGGSVEEIARTARLASLIKIAKSQHAQAIALAHQSDDLAETILMRILRGTGLQGLQAILPQRQINGTLFIRPLLGVSRKEIENYLARNKIKFRTDPTNAKTYFYRNKIRLELLPYLEIKYQNNIKNLLGNLALTAGEDYLYIQQQAHKIFTKITTKAKARISIDLNKMQKSPMAIKRMILRLAIESIKGNTRTLTLTHFLEIDDLISNRPDGAIVNLPNQLSVKKEKNLLIFSI